VFRVGGMSHDFMSTAGNAMTAKSFRKMVMNDSSRKDKKIDESIAGQSATLFLADDDSLAGLVLSHGIKVRDFILLSFLSDQGSMDMVRLARVVGIELAKAERGLERLSAAGLVLRDPKSAHTDMQMMVTLTGRGQDVANRITDQLPS